MGPMTMQMTGSNGILSVPSEHLPGLIVLVVITPTVWIAMSVCRTLAAGGGVRTGAFLRRLDGLSFTAKTALFGMLVGGLVHAAIVPTHWHDERVTALLFIADTASFAFASWWTFGARRYWRLVDVAILGGTAGAYALYILKGWESADPVGLLTTTIELAAALVVLSPAPAATTGSGGVRDGWIAAAALPLALVSILGTTAIAGAALTPATSATGASTHSTKASTGSNPTSPSMPGMPSRGRITALSLPTASPAGPIVWPDDMASMASGMAMVTPNCDTQPTSSQQAAAVNLVNQTVAAASVYKSLAVAKEAGYIPITPTGQRIVHYINPTIYRQGNILDPRAIPVLVYVNTSHGAVLSAAMYLMPQSNDATPAQPGGCLTQWHIHTDLCFRSGKVVGNDNAAGTCSSGSVNRTTQPMMHVWLTPVSGGPLAPDPPAVSEVRAAGEVPPLATPNAMA